MGVTAYVGLHGSGKTYHLAEVGLDASRQGRKVYNNFGLEVPGAIPVLTWGDVLAVRDGVLLIDEMGVLAPARAWAKFPPALTLVWTQARKMGLDIHYSTQSLDYVDKYIREVTGAVVACSAWGFGGEVKLFSRRRYHGWEYGKSKARSQWGFRRPKPDVYGAYDTMRMIDLAVHLLDEQIAAIKGLNRGYVEGIADDSSPMAPDSVESGECTSRRIPPNRASIKG